MHLKDYFEGLSTKKRQWIWFIGLWFAGLLTVASIGYAIKFLMFFRL